MQLPAWPVAAAACVLGLMLTLALAGCFSPRRWWRRPTAANLALSGAGTLAFGALFCVLFAARPAPAPVARTAAAERQAGTVRPAPAPLRYRVVDDLNLRTAKATGARRLAVLPAGSMVETLGQADGDWWRVRARVGGRTVEGWASSLWLRRVDEGRGGADG